MGSGECTTEQAARAPTWLVFSETGWLSPSSARHQHETNSRYSRQSANRPFNASLDQYLAVTQGLGTQPNPVDVTGTLSALT